MFAAVMHRALGGVAARVLLSVYTSPSLQVRGWSVGGAVAEMREEQAPLKNRSSDAESSRERSRQLRERSGLTRRG